MCTKANVLSCYRWMTNYCDNFCNSSCTYSIVLFLQVANFTGTNMCRRGCRALRWDTTVSVCGAVAKPKPPNFYCTWWWLCGGSHFVRSIYGLDSSIFTESPYTQTKFTLVSLSLVSIVSLFHQSHETYSAVLRSQRSDRIPNHHSRYRERAKCRK
jgi:hypothetical protein